VMTTERTWLRVGGERLSRSWTHNVHVTFDIVRRNPCRTDSLHHVESWKPVHKSHVS
jgi:hypothetical protein